MKTIIKFIICLCSVVTPLASIFAQDVEQFHMKSGSIIEGYIAEQYPGKYITIQSRKATIVVSSDSLKDHTSEYVALSSLPKAWQRWASENNIGIVCDGEKQIELTTLVFGKTKYSNVYLLEKGSLLKFIDLTSNEYTFLWGDMYKTVKNRRPVNLFSGLKEVIILKDGTEYNGQIIEQYPGKDLKILTEQGEVLSFKFSQIKQIKTKKLNDKFSLWSQIQLLDRVQVKGKLVSYEGFISSRTLSKELVIESKDGQKRIIPLEQIASYAKFPNDEYKSVYDKILKDGEILLNGTPAHFVTLKSQGKYLLLAEIVSAQLAMGETVCLEAKLSNPNTPITLVKAHVENIIQRNGRKKVEVSWPVITYEDLIKSQIAVTREVTPLGNIKISFTVEDTGDYVLYFQGKEEVIVINVIV